MEEHTINNKLLLEIIEYIEQKEVMVDGEWGSCRRLNELIKDNEMPPLWIKLKTLSENK